MLKQISRGGMATYRLMSMKGYVVCRVREIIGVVICSNIHSSISCADSSDPPHVVLCF